jgi:MoaA/NifB/PqqE/SkfB family radical SAM enzyme
MDIEISEGFGCPVSCPFCYKGNGKGDKATNMSFATFQQIFSTFPKSVTQIAFGITSVGSHPQLFEIFKYCRDHQVIPNVTINGSDKLTDEQIAKLVKVCGAIAISVVPPHFDEGFGLISRLHKAGLKQLNIHYMISKQSIDNAYKICDAIKNDPRLKGLNAIVFLGLKPKERGQAYNVLPTDDFVKLVDYCLAQKIPFGFDSCSCCKFMKAIEDSKTMANDMKNQLAQRAEPCESGLFSAYIDSSGKYWHCSFGENRNDSGGLDVTAVKDFVKEVWLHPTMTKWRKKLLSLDRECPLYPEIRVKHINVKI